MSNFTINHFSLTMLEGKGHGNLPELLRRLATAIEEESDVDRKILLITLK
jgi:hypothetical protein